MFKLIERLPLNSRDQLEHFIIHLIKQAKENEIDIDLSDIGSIIASDFDVPLKEFHDYMYKVDLKFVEKIE